MAKNKVIKTLFTKASAVAMAVAITATSMTPSASFADTIDAVDETEDETESAENTQPKSSDEVDTSEGTADPGSGEDSSSNDEEEETILVDTTLNSSVGKHNASISGQMPENATFVADKITDVSDLEATVNTTLDTTDFKIYDAFNLSVLDSLGQAWQPEEDLKISLDNLDIPSGIADGSIEVYRISDDPELAGGNTIACDQMLIEEVNAKAKTLTFTTDHFTAFVVGSSAKPSTSGGNADHEHQLLYTDLGNGTHRVTCKVEGCAYSLTKTCDYVKDPTTGKNVCKVCGGIKKAGEHTHQLRYKDNGDGTHTITCLMDDCDYKKIEDCTYELDKDGVRKCSVCGAEKAGDHKHKLVAEDQGNGTHLLTCKDLDCDYKEIEDCKWEKDEKTGKTICSVCGAEKKVLNHDHKLKITDLGNNTHKLSCEDKNCAYEKNEDCKYRKKNSM